MYTVTFNDVAHINDVDGFEITFPFPDRVGIVVADPAKAALANYYMAWALAAPTYIEAVGDVDRAMIALVADEHRHIDGNGHTLVYWPDTVTLTD
ncbi:hypothetical protein [Nocardia terpenica]|uniref:Uncharacterized protein n=1 Tax=Nocardia terpenica TaxID=455432 RepID=A0A164H9K1_9NOCA|nr:hypothetical protein [Nocardia terpenica]KZM68316.1 hypothetical protein AWN90_10505 [Nocardia terpenica]NQE88777.1 hypothetical protein [Nocardia terpenica]